MDKILIQYLICALQIQGLVYVIFDLGLRKKFNHLSQIKIYIGLTALLFITLSTLIYTLYANQMIKV